jgi:hypothetical protein
MEYQITKTFDINNDNDDNIIIKSYSDTKINYSDNMNLLKEKINSLDKRIDFVDKHSINFNNNINNNLNTDILSIINKIDSIINLINKNVIAKAQLSNIKNIECEFDF